MEVDIVDLEPEDYDVCHTNLWHMFNHHFRGGIHESRLELIVEKDKRYKNSQALHKALTERTEEHLKQANQLMDTFDVSFK